MEIQIIHETEYEYTKEVFFEPHYLRFKPRNTPYLQLRDFTLDVWPKPVGISQLFDAESNSVHLCWYNDKYHKLNIKAVSTLTVSDYNPFNFLLWPQGYDNVPFSYSNDLQHILAPYLKAVSLGDYLRRYASEILLNKEAGTITALGKLTVNIHSDFKLETRLSGEPHTPDTTFELKKGSCRDLAWMQIQILRNFGIAARFVSGYYFIDADQPQYELHAWTEVFLPGAGWIGYDPSNGVRTTNRYFPVCSSADYRNTMPVTGTVRGDGNSLLKTRLEIKLV